MKIMSFQLDELAKNESFDDFLCQTASLEAT